MQLQEALKWFFINMIIAASPGVGMLVYSFITYPPMWWRRWRSARTKGAYRWRVYE